MRLFLIGIPGSGKGTVSKLLLEALSNDIRYYNVGGILREQASQDEHIKKVHADGGLVDSNRVLKIFDDVLMQEQFICDGSPRKLNEAEYIFNHLAWARSPGYLVHLDLDTSIARERLEHRGRFDDTPETIQNRFDNYFENTVQSIDLFKRKKRLVTVNAEASPTIVCDTIIKALSELS